MLHGASRHGLRLIKGLTPVLLIGSFLLTLAVMVPHVGVQVNGATRWLAAGRSSSSPPSS